MEKIRVAIGDLEREGRKIHYELYADGKKHYVKVFYNGLEVEAERNIELPLPVQIMKMLKA